MYQTLYNALMFLQELVTNPESQPDKYPIDAVQCDLSDETQIMAMFEYIRATYGHVDVCINNGGVGLHASLLEGDTEKWKQVLDVGIV